MIRLGELMDEALGVPEGTLEAAVKVYNYILDTLDAPDSKTLTVEEESGIEMSMNNPTTVSDYVFKTVNVKIEAGIYDRTKEIITRGMAYNFSPELVNKYKGVKVSGGLDEVDLSIDLIVPPNTTWDGIRNHLREDRTQTISSLAHELKHAYDAFKIPSKKVSDIVSYRALMNRIGLPALDEFLYYIYYTSATEGLVRPTELASNFIEQGVEPKDFLQALKDSQIYKNLKRAQTITYDEVIKELSSTPEYITSIDTFLQNNKIDITNLTDEQKAKKLLEMYFESVKKDMMTFYQQLVTKDQHLPVFAQMFGIPPGFFNKEQQDAINDFSKELNSFGSFEKFFKFQEKKVHANADKSIRKLAKLYAYIK